MILYDTHQLYNFWPLGENKVDNKVSFNVPENFYLTISNSHIISDTDFPFSLSDCSLENLTGTMSEVIMNSEESESRDILEQEDCYSPDSLNDPEYTPE